MNRSTLAMLALLAAAPAGLVADEIKSSDKGHMGAAAMSDEDQAMQAQKIRDDAQNHADQGRRRT